MAVAGDFCLDSYWQLDDGPGEISIETGLAVHRVASQRYSPGGAGNVVANLIALGVGHVRALGVYGGDPFGPVLVRLLTDLGADTAGMLDLGPGTGRRSCTPSPIWAATSKAGSTRDPGRHGSRAPAHLRSGPRRRRRMGGRRGGQPAGEQLLRGRGDSGPGKRRDRRPPRHDLCRRRPHVDGPLRRGGAQAERGREPPPPGPSRPGVPVRRPGHRPRPPGGRANG